VFAQTAPPHSFRGWDASGGGGTAGVSRHWYFQSQPTSVFTHNPGVADCEKFCGLTVAQAMEALQTENAPGLNARTQYCTTSTPASQGGNSQGGNSQG